MLLVGRYKLPGSQRIKAAAAGAVAVFPETVLFSSSIESFACRPMPPPIGAVFPVNGRIGHLQVAELFHSDAAAAADICRAVGGVARNRAVADCEDP